MKEYKITVAGVEQTVQLSDEDAKARGLTAEDQAGDNDVPEPGAEPEATPDAEQPAESAEQKQAKAPANKARSAEEK